MLNFRRRLPAARTEPAPIRAAKSPAPPASPNAEKARALMAMIEQGGDGSAAGVAPERLRDWARDLVETVERRQREGRLPPGSSKPAARTAAAATADAAVGPARPARLFTTAAPVLIDAPAPAPQHVAARPWAAVTQPGYDAPMPYAPPHAAAPPSAMRARAELRSLIEATVDPENLAREHPAVIAMTLAGRPTLEQAAALRRLPGGQTRAVRRALRQLELGRPA